MIDFDEEIKKYHPNLEVEEAGNAIYNQDFTDMADIVVQMLEDPKGTGRNQHTPFAN